MQGHDFPEAYTVENLQEIINANDACPSLATGEVQRLVDLAKQRASTRDELEEDQFECLIGTEWSSFASDEFGFDNGDVNQFAFGVFEADVSAGKGADLFNETVVVQRGWLTSGDGRRAQIEPYMDDDYDNADEGEMWIPNGAQEYMLITALSEELLKEA